MRRWPPPRSSCSAAPTAGGSWCWPARATTAPTGGRRRDRLRRARRAGRGGRRAGAPDRLPDCDLVIDAAYGTGFRGEHHAPGGRGPPVLAVDIPSGVSGTTGEAHGPVLAAERTVTFAALKPGLLLEPGRSLAGEVQVADIGLDVGERRVGLVERDDVAAWLPARPTQAHKWRAALLVVAGSPGMTGAARLAAAAAQRAGAGMVRSAAPGSTTTVPARSRSSACPCRRRAGPTEALAAADRCHAVVVGPGSAPRRGTAEEVRVLLAVPLPVVVDGDGLTALGVDAARRPVGPDPRRRCSRPTTASSSAWPATPGSGSDRGRPVAGGGHRRRGAAQGLAHRRRRPAGEVRVVATGDARLATAGTGDVLSGVIGALLAQGLPALEAAAAGAWLHGRAGASGPARGLVAGDLRGAGAGGAGRGLRRWRLMARAWAEVSLGAIAANVEALRAACAPAEVCAVVKADGYGHGAAPVARAALEAGADVARRRPGARGHRAARRRHRRADPAAVRAAGQRGRRGARRPDAHHRVHRRHGGAPRRCGRGALGGAPLPVHLKVDTGMRRVGASPADVVALAEAVDAHPALALEAVWTHCAVADEPDDPFTALQLERYEAVAGRGRGRRHRGPAAPRRQLGRGASPTRPPATTSSAAASPSTASPRPPALAGGTSGCEPAVRLATEVSFVKPVAAGEGVSYGLRHHLERDTVVATLPIGYADGVFRSLGLGSPGRADRRAPVPDGRRGHDGPGDGRRGPRRRGAGGRRGRAPRRAGRRADRRPTSGRRGSARSPTRSSAPSAPGSSGGTPTGG